MDKWLIKSQKWEENRKNEDRQWLHYRPDDKYQIEYDDAKREKILLLSIEYHQVLKTFKLPGTFRKLDSSRSHFNANEYGYVELYKMFGTYVCTQMTNCVWEILDYCECQFSYNSTEFKF